MKITFRRATPRVPLVVSAVAGSLLLAACGSSASGDNPVSSNATGSGSAASACVAKANSFLADWQQFPTTLPASPPARYTKLTTPPPSGKRIVYIRQNFPAGEGTFKGVSDGAAKLGWKAESVIFDNTLPDFLAKLDTVIASKPDFVSWSGFPAAAAQKQIDAAKAAGVNVVITSTPDNPVSTPGLAAVGNGTATVKLIADIQAYMALSTSGCKANTVIFSLDYPIIKINDDEYTRVIAQNCPDCKVDVVTIQAQDIGTPAATQQMVAKLQASPDFKYAYTVIGDLSNGLAQALKTAGVDGVNIFGAVPNENSIAALRDGTNAWWVNQSSYINGLDTIDMAARVAATGRIQSDPGGYPLALLTPKNVPAGTGQVVIPENILDLYAASWDVG